MPIKAERLQNLPPYIFSTIADSVGRLQADGKDVVRLDVGSPDLPPPDFVIDALYQSAQNPKHHGYSGYKGITTFREAVARYYKRRFQVDLNPETEVLPLIGSKEGIVNLSLAFLDRGDIALVPDVGYPAYAMGTRLAGGTVHWLPTRAENSFLTEFANVPSDVLKKAKLLWTNYPNNPTGAVANPEYYNELVSYCLKHDILLASDNPYVDVTFDNFVASSVLQVEGSKSTTVEFMSLSKTYNMAGWRLGAAVGNAEALKSLLHVKSNVDSGHFRAIYDAGTIAIDKVDEEWIQARNNIYQLRRDIIMSALENSNFEVHESPKATLYIWAKINSTDDDFELVKSLLNEAHVSVAPGSAYGPGGKGYVRISLSVPEDRLELGLQRLQSWSENKANSH